MNQNLLTQCGNNGILLPRFFRKFLRQINVLLKNSNLTVNQFDEKKFEWQ